MTRAIAFELISRVRNDDAYANLLLPTLLARANIEGRDAGFAQELAFGTLRNQLLYEKIIQNASGRELSAVEPNALIVLLLGCHQLLDMRVPTHAAINESVNLAKAKASKGSVGFVNAVLRKIASKDKDAWIDDLTSKLSNAEALEIIYSHPSWIAKSLKAALTSRGLQDGFEDLLDANNKPAKVSIVALPGLVEVDQVRGEAPVGPASPIGFEIVGSPAALESVQSGKCRVQDQGSQLMALALASAPVLCHDEMWLDMCAGPGGKAALLAGLARVNGAKLICNEVSTHRADLVRTALRPFPEAVVVEDDGRRLGLRPERFTRILVDAPCTGLGALRRRPESRWRRTTDDLTDLIALQRQLLESAWELLRPGGVVAYVTCSPHLSETTAQIAWFESKFKGEVELINANTLLNSINPQLSLDESFRTTQLWPHVHGTDAMFLALIRKSID